jgi:hypothetical protein
MVQPRTNEEVSTYYVNLAKTDSDGLPLESEQEKASLRRVEMELDESEKIVCSLGFLALDNPPYFYPGLSNGNRDSRHS